MKTKALIIGGGVAGLTLALLLGKSGLQCVLVDIGKPLTDKDIKLTGRTAALMNSSTEVIKATGIWPEIKDLATPLQKMRLKDDGNPNIEVKEVTFPAKDIGLEQFAFNIPNLSLQKTLQDAVLVQNNVKHLTKDSLSDYIVSENQITATLASGTVIHADVIIGCDGRGSKTRQIAGIGVQEEEYGQNAITCMISHTKPHENISTEHHRSGGPFTIVPMEGKTSSIVWVEKTDDAERIIKLSKDLFESALQKNTHGLVGQVTLMSNPESWPLKSLIADKLVAPRCAIAAEAAHVMSPIGAQGLNLSLRDVAALAETIIDAARNGEDIGSPLVLNKYEQRRKMDIATRVAGINKFNKIVSNNIGFLRGLRRSGLTALDAIPPLKQLIMHQGLAPTMDEGRLMRGEAL